MLQVKPSELPSETAEYLAGKQAELDALSSYANQVEKATENWSRKSRRHFEVIRERLKAEPGGEAVNRCHYCEDSIADEVEHIWPKKFYPDRVFIWDNYLYSCGPCNGTAKRDQFAVIVNGERFDLVRGKTDPVLEPPEGRPLFIDPRQENPFDFIELELDTGLFMARDMDESSLSAQRAEYTAIEILELNRDSLVHRRKREYRSLVRTVESYASARDSGDQETADLAWGDLQSPLMPTVWHEMIRSRGLYPKLKTLFEQVPELLE